MMKTLKIAAFTATAAMASACSATNGEGLASPGLASEQAHQPQLCEAAERQVFSASSAEDEFGYGIAVCVLPGSDGADDRVTVVYSGEGGSLRTSCLASECGGVLEFNRYTRYRFTELTLKWRDKYADNRIIETFDAQDLEGEPISTVTHYWLSDDNKERGFEEVPENLTGYEPLSLMKLESSLPGE